MEKAKINKTKNQINVTVDPNLYPLEAVYGASYVFLDRAYLRLDGDPKKEIIIRIKGKEELNKKELNNLANDFLNELLNYSLRYKISNNNRKIREYIVGKALFSSMPLGLPEERKEGKEDWEKDGLGISVPWEEKYEK
jgi:His-Xaa-Ser system protein HxsD